MINILPYSTISNKEFKDKGNWTEFGEINWVTFENCDFYDCSFTENCQFVTFKNCQFHECHFSDGNCVTYAFEFNTCIFWETHFAANGFTLLKLKYCGFYDCHIVNAHVELDKNKVISLLGINGYATDVFCEHLNEGEIKNLTPLTDWEFKDLIGAHREDLL